jgi:hypothetical protein
MKIAFAAAFALAAVALAGEGDEGSPAGVTVETVAASKFLWSGYEVNSSPSLQPAVTVEYRGLSFTTWHNFSRRTPHNQAWTEHDATLEYSHTFGKFTGTTGYTYYSFPDIAAGEGNGTHEFYAGIAYESRLTPTFRAYRDVSLARGYYYSAGVSDVLPLNRKLRFRWAASAGLNHHYYQTQTALSDVTSTVALEVALTGKVTLSPEFTHMVGHRTLFGRHHAFALRLATGN